MAPDNARPLIEDAPGWADLDPGIWFQCACGRIGHISELLFTSNTTQMWCPLCQKDEWRWTNKRNEQNALIAEETNKHQH